MSKKSRIYQLKVADPLKNDYAYLSMYLFQKFKKYFNVQCCVTVNCVKLCFHWKNKWAAIEVNDYLVIADRKYCDEGYRRYWKTCVRCGAWRWLLDRKLRAWVTRQQKHLTGPLLVSPLLHPSLRAALSNTTIQPPF